MGQIHVHDGCSMQADAREYWLSLYWAVSGDREDCAYAGWPHLNPLHPKRWAILGANRAKLATWRLDRMMRSWRFTGGESKKLGYRESIPSVVTRALLFRRRGASGVM